MRFHIPNIILPEDLHRSNYPGRHNRRLQTGDWSTRNGDLKHLSSSPSSLAESKAILISNMKDSSRTIDYILQLSWHGVLGGEAARRKRGDEYFWFLLNELLKWILPLENFKSEMVEFTLFEIHMMVLPFDFDRFDPSPSNVHNLAMTLSWTKFDGKIMIYIEFCIWKNILNVLGVTYF